MEQLWSDAAPQTVREVHEALATDRTLAYSTVTTVLRRLATKDLVLEFRDARAHRFRPMQGRSELVAELIIEALDQVSETDARQAALARFVARVGPAEAATLRGALLEGGDRRAAALVRPL